MQGAAPAVCVLARLTTLEILSASSSNGESAVSAEPNVVQETETSLDPEDWEAFRRLGHEVFDELVDYLRDVAERPAWRELPAKSLARFIEPAPRRGRGDAAAWAEVREHVLPYPTGNIHPRFWSWVGGTGTPTQLLADMVISAMNSCSLGFDEASSSHVELQLLDWLKELLDYPRDASALLVSGGSMANLVGLAVARNAQSTYDLRDEGINTRNQPRLVFYASAETHSSVRKAIELLGLGSRSLRLLPVQDDFTIDVAALRDAIRADRAAGQRPACIIANAGTVNSGAADPLDTLADIAEAERLWLHVDGAFGAFLRLAPSGRHLVAGLERADSVAFDLHKWLYVQYNCGGVFVRADRLHRNTFSVVPDYLRNLERGLAAGPRNFSEYGVQLSRSFVALRAWMALQSAGADRYASQIEQNLAQARYLDGLVARQSSLQRLAPTSMNIVNFRYYDATLDDERLDELNARILMRLHEDGIATPSSTVLNGRFSIRVANCNHRSRRADFRALTEAVVRLGDELRREVSSGG